MEHLFTTNVRKIYITERTMERLSPTKEKQKINYYSEDAYSKFQYLKAIVYSIFDVSCSDQIRLKLQHNKLYSLKFDAVEIDLWGILLCFLDSPLSMRSIMLRTGLTASLFALFVSQYFSKKHAKLIQL